MPRRTNGVVTPAFRSLVVQALALLRYVLHYLVQETFLYRKYGLQEARYIGEDVVCELVDDPVLETQRM